MSNLCVSWYQSTRVCLFFNISSWHFNIIEKLFDFNLRSSDSSLTYPPVPPPRLAVSAADSQPGLSHPYCHGHAYMNIMGYIYSRANFQLQIFLTLMLSSDYFYGWYQWILTESLTNYEIHHYFLFTPAYTRMYYRKITPHPKEKKIKYKIFAIHENWTHKFKEYSTFTDVCTCMYFDYQEADWLLYFILFIYLGARESNSSKNRTQGLALWALEREK